MDHRDELLKKSWEGEVLGRSYFAAMVDVLPGDRAMWERLTALETTMEGLVEPVAMAHGLEIDRKTVEETGVSFAALGTDREMVFKELLNVVSDFLQTYKELTGLLSDDEQWLGHELLAHEKAFAYYVERELAGQEGGEEKVVEFLARHGAEIPAVN